LAVGERHGWRRFPDRGRLGATCSWSAPRPRDAAGDVAVAAGPTTEVGRVGWTGGSVRGTVVDAEGRPWRRRGHGPIPATTRRGPQEAGGARRSDAEIRGLAGSHRRLRLAPRLGSGSAGLKWTGAGPLSAWWSCSPAGGCRERPPARPVGGDRHAAVFSGTPASATTLAEDDALLPRQPAPARPGSGSSSANATRRICPAGPIRRGDTTVVDVDLREIW
jgi:hypothetical protein